MKRNKIYHNETTGNLYLNIISRNETIKSLVLIWIDYKIPPSGQLEVLPIRVREYDKN